MTPNFLLRGEYRRDWFQGGKDSNKVFPKGTGSGPSPGNSGFKRSQDVVVLEAALLFD